MPRRGGALTSSGLWCPWIGTSEAQLLPGDLPSETLPGPDRLQGSYLTEFFVFLQDKSATTGLLAGDRGCLLCMETTATTNSSANLPGNLQLPHSRGSWKSSRKFSLDLTLEGKERALQSSSNTLLQLIIQTWKWLLLLKQIKWTEHSCALLSVLFSLIFLPGIFCNEQLATI